MLPGKGQESPGVKTDTTGHHVSRPNARARRSPLVKAVPCPCTLSMHIALYGMLRRTGEAGDHRKAVRGLTGAASPLARPAPSWAAWRELLRRPRHPRAALQRYSL